jgi:nonsense-mediated mRNA decay protein 3
MFCPKCGKKGRGLCFECLLEGNPIKTLKPRIEFCECGKVRFREKWVDGFVEVLPILTQRMIKLPEHVRMKDVSVVPKPAKKTLAWDATLLLEYGGKTHSKTITCHAAVSKSKCPSCSRSSSRYFEAVLQVRERSPPIEPDEREISDVRYSRGGVDYYVKSVSHARKILKEYKKRGYAVSEAEKLYGQKDGRDVYRVNFSAKPPKYSVGDVLEHENKVFHVASVGASTRLVDVTSNTQRTVPTQTLADARIIARKKELSDAVIATVTPRETQALELSTGRVFDVKSSGGFREGEEACVLFHGGRTFVLKKFAG